MPRERGCRVHLRHPGRGEHRRHGCAAGQPHPLHHHAPRAGRRLHGGRLRAPDRQGGRVHLHTRPRRDQSDHRRRRCQHGPRAGGRDRRPGRNHAHAQGESPDPGSGEPVPADHQVQQPDPRARDRHRDRAQSVQGGPDRETGRLLHRFPREHRRDRGGRQETDRGAERLHFRAAGVQDRRGRTHHLRGEVPGDHGRERCDPPARVRFAGQLRRGLAYTRGHDFHGQGGDTVFERLLAGNRGAQIARPGVVRFRAGRRGDLHRL